METLNIINRVWFWDYGLVMIIGVLRNLIYSASAYLNSNDELCVEMLSLDTNIHTFLLLNSRCQVDNCLSNNQFIQSQKLNGYFTHF